MNSSTRIVGDTFFSDMLVRFSHCDPAGIVFYPQYFIMFNGLVEDWFNQGMGVDYARYITEHRLGFPMVNLQCEFIAPSKIGEIITLGLRLERIGRSSLAIEVNCTHQGNVRLRAHFVLVSMDLDKQTAVATPDDLRARMEAFRDGRLDTQRRRP